MAVTALSNARASSHPSTHVSGSFRKRPVSMHRKKTFNGAIHGVEHRGTHSQCAVEQTCARQKLFSAAPSIGFWLSHHPQSASANLRKPSRPVGFSE